MPSKWHERSVKDVFKIVESSEKGLANAEARRRLLRYGPNTLPEKKQEGITRIFLRQFASPLIYILLVAAVLVALMGEFADGAIILVVLVFNAIVGTIQEGRAQNTLKALRHFSETFAVALREGREIIIPDAEIVRGDLLVLQAGEKVPADARIVYARSLHADEAALTGESNPVSKSAEVEPEGGDAHANMVFKGTNIVTGSGTALVVATGPATEFGKIAEAVVGVETEIPLQKDVRNLARLIVIAVLFGSVIFFTFGLSLGVAPLQMFATVVSLAVSVVPEGLPIVMTLVLATGVWRMGKRNALVKRLAAVEALGQARIIAVDKTGTLTKNEMVVEKVYVDGVFFSIEGVGYEPSGRILAHGKDARDDPALLRAARIAALSSGAHAQLSEDGQWRVAGDPTEAAMAVLAGKAGLHKNELERETPLTEEIPFDSDLRYHAVMHGKEGKGVISITGAPEIVLGLSTHVVHGGKSESLTSVERKRLEDVFLEMSGDGLRVVAVAERVSPSSAVSPEEIRDLTLVGFLGLKDALRAEVRDAMEKAKHAGMRVVMITGDHAATARAIAHEAGIFVEGDTILTGAEIDKFSDLRLRDEVGVTSVFARVTPEHKLRIIEAYRASGTVVAMTGDGVNDAPSLVAADLGVAMGKIGTEVAKEAADIVLLDDNFGSIVAAVEEGRSMYKTIKKVILFLFSTSLGEVFTIVGALVIGLPIPLLPAQILWLNFVTDPFLDAGLAMEPKEQGLLTSTFKRPGKYLVDRLMAHRMLFMAIPMAIGSLFLFYMYLPEGFEKASTVALTVLAVFQWFNAWNCRSDKGSAFSRLFGNTYLIGATTLVFSLQLLAVYSPVFQKILHTVPLSFADWLNIIPVAASILLVEEARKFFVRSSSRARNTPHSLTKTV